MILLAVAQIQHELNTNLKYYCKRFKHKTIDLTTLCSEERNFADTYVHVHILVSGTREILQDYNMEWLAQ